MGADVVPPLPPGFQLDSPEPPKGFKIDGKPATFAEAEKHAKSFRDNAPYNMGGEATDWASKYLPPGGAAAVGTAVNLGSHIPEMLMGGGIGGAIKVPLQAGARRLMQFALKPDRSSMMSGSGPKAINTALEQVRNPTIGGVESGWNEVSGMNKQVKQLLNDSPQTVSAGEAGTGLASQFERVSGRPDPSSGQAEVLRQYGELKKHSYLDASGNMPVAQAHKMKTKAYEQIGDAPYERLTNPDATATRMATAQGLRDAVVKKVPETGPLLKKEAELINWLDVAEPRALMQGNTSLTGMAPIAPNAQSMFAYLLGKMPLANSVAAHGLYQTGKKMPLLGTAAGASVDVKSEEVKALAEALRNKLGDK